MNRLYKHHAENSKNCLENMDSTRLGNEWVGGWLTQANRYGAKTTKAHLLDAGIGEYEASLLQRCDLWFNGPRKPNTPAF